LSVTNESFVVLERQQDDVERQPADGEDRDHRDQHPVGASLAAQLEPVANVGRSVLGWSS